MLAFRIRMPWVYIATPLTTHSSSIRRRSIFAPLPNRDIHITKMETIQGPTPADAVILFEAIKQRFPHNALGNDSWYLVVVSLQILCPSNYGN
jgi:hypothetical protein